jgi:hypothetical protein
VADSLSLLTLEPIVRGGVGGGEVGGREVARGGDVDADKGILGERIITLEILSVWCSGATYRVRIAAGVVTHGSAGCGSGSGLFGGRPVSLLLLSLSSCEKSEGKNTR